MRTNVTSALFGAAAVIIALGLFFAGFWVRGWIDDERPVSASAPLNPTAPQGSTSLASPPATSVPLVTNVSVDDDPARGPENAAVTMIEFSDFQCPFCKRFFDETLPLVLSTYGSKIRFVYRDFPISSSHPQAQKAAEGAQCAFDQGKFWEYHDTIFQNQGAMDISSLKKYAVDLGLNASTFNTCLDSDKYRAEVEKDFNDGRSYGVTGTPTFFINGRKVVGAVPFATLQQVIDEELAKASTR